MRKCLRVWAVFGLLLPALVTAQDFPSKPITILCWSEPGSPVDYYARIMARLMTRELGQNVVVENRTGADGVHLTTMQMMATRNRPDLPWVAASCHTAEDMRAAERLGVDFAVLGPVLPTASHPGAAHLGWEAFSTLVQGSSIPVYALGGLQPALLDTARMRGAQGIAMLSGSWKV